MKTKSIFTKEERNRIYKQVLKNLTMNSINNIHVGLCVEISHVIRGSKPSDILDNLVNKADFPELFYMKPWIARILNYTYWWDKHNTERRVQVLNRMIKMTE